MMIKNILIITAAVCLACTSANASSLVKMDIKKTSENAVDITFYTTGSASSSLPTRKSNNKYVILMPNIAGKTAGTPDLSAVKDLISSVDIKNVDDGLGGYTKVTLITTKPINIKTHTEKTAPLTTEEKEAQNIIAQAKTHPQQTTAASEQKTEPVKTTVTSSNAVQTAAQSTAAKTESTAAKPAKTVQNTVKQVQPQVQQKVQPKVQPAATETKPAAATETTPKIQQTKNNRLDIKEIDKIEKISKTEPAKKPNNYGWAIIFFPLLLLYLLGKSIKNSILKSNILSGSFKAHLSSQPHKQENYDDLINNSDLNWQERYKKFVEETKGENKNRKYTFISSTVVNSTDKKPPEPVNTLNKTGKKPPEPDNTLNETDKKRLELESSLSKTPEIYEVHEIDISENTVPEVVSEDDTIQKEISTIKLKAFAKPVSLHTSYRNRVKKTIVSNPAAKEGKFVELKKTPLNVSKRKFGDANLKVSDLMAIGNRYLELNNAEIDIKEKEQKYVMSSIDEYFALLDKEKSTSDNDLSRKVAASLAQVKPSMRMQKPGVPAVTNPFKQKNDAYLSGLVVKSGYNIDENKGFYLVSLDGVSALVGRVDEEIFVLKKFDTNVDKLQVRPDSANVYMVKAGDFKSLVDVDKDKMGVLIEL